MLRVKKFIALSLALFMLVSVTPLDLFAAGKGVEKNIPSLSEVYKSYFKIGAAVTPRDIANPQTAELIKKHFNSLTAENEMKMGNILKDLNTYDFTGADKIADFAKANKKVIRGHTLIYHLSTPDWFFKDEKGKDVTRDVLLKRMKEYITTVLTHFKKNYPGVIYAWDVCNEVIDTNSKDRKYTQSPYFKIIGSDYIEKAFQYAREADPNVLLFYNDTGMESDTNKAKAVADLAQSLKAKKLIDGVGIQCHVSLLQPVISTFKKNLDYYKNLGVKIEITELDMSVYNNTKQKQYDICPEKVLIKQANRYKDLFDLFKKYKGVISNVSFWGTEDGMSWHNSFFVKRKDYPLLFDRDLKAKYAYWAIVDPKKVPKLPK